MTTLEEHNARVEEMKAAEERIRKWLDDSRMHVPWVEVIRADVRLLLERIDAYEASVTWHTNCLNCPKLLDLNLAAHEALEKAREKAIEECAIFAWQYQEEHHPNSTMSIIARSFSHKVRALKEKP